MRALQGALAIAATVATTAAYADGRGHDGRFIAFDVGAESGSDTEATAGLILGIERDSNNFIVSAGITRGHGETSLADVAVGYYRSFHAGWLTPELGLELGLLNEATEHDGVRMHHVEVLERVGGALLHHFENHMFAGVVSDVNFAAVHFANVRALFEVGVQL